MGILDNINNIIKEKRELKRYEQEAYIQAKTECEDEIRQQKIEDAKQKGIDRAKGIKTKPPIIEKMAKMGENYNKNMAERGTMLKFGENK